ncbi:hypothetical protein HHK36_031347 [Tetracentron sinense]|uniref:AT-hook motif nuclear-localized protein n=1 Tax=Tetracentron sinense TaxID=13715 RepID=A0A834YAQ6_TETSI|nr:hypothetical protein HHK36_031347 [Tetracentron sinense]
MMSGSEHGIMSARESFGVGLQKNPVPSPSPGMQNMRLAFSADGTAVYKPVTASSPTFQAGVGAVGGGGGGGGDGSAGAIIQHGLNMNMGEPMKRKRGRPRKYGPDGTMALALTPAPPAVQSGGFSPPSATSPASSKKARGRPPGSGKKQQMAALGSAGVGFTPHVITVKAGEVSHLSFSFLFLPKIFYCIITVKTNNINVRNADLASTMLSYWHNKAGRVHTVTDDIGIVAHIGILCFISQIIVYFSASQDVSSKIMSFSQNGPRAVCILSANGAISNVTLRQAATSGGTVTYEGRFEILSLSGSFLLSESGGQRSRTGGLSVSLAGPDGRVLGGGVAGLLTAASPVQVVVGSFIADGRKESKTTNQPEPLSVMPKLGPGGGSTGPVSPPSRGTLSESSGGPGSPLNQSTGACNNSNPQGMGNMPWK